MNGSFLADREAIDRWQWYSLLVGLAAAAVSAISAIFAPAEFFRAYLPPYFFFQGLALGSLALVMIYHLTGGAWGLLVRRIVEAQMKTLPLMVLLFLPIALGLGYVYPWANAGTAAAEAHKTVREIYLDPRFFYWRAVGYFAVWLVLTHLLSRWSRRQDEEGEVRIAWKCYKLSGPGLVVFGVLLHFAAVDWIMSLDPKFTSTIFGPLVFSGQALASLAVAVFVFGQVMDRAEIARLDSTGARNDLGSLLFTLLVLWGYMVWFQFMLVWIADMPKGAGWYVARSAGGWSWMAWFLLVFHFAVPFLLLLMRAVKRTPVLLSGVALLIAATQLVFLYYQIMPAFGAGGIGQLWMDLVTPVAIGGIWSANFLWLLKRMPLVPVYDRNERQAIHLRRIDEAEAAREEALAHG
jgi:hypothetical protein